MRQFVRFFAITGVSIIALAVVAVLVIVPVVVSNASAAGQKNVAVSAQQQNAYSLLDTSAGQVAYGWLTENDWRSFCYNLGVVSNTTTHDGVVSTTIRNADSEDNIVLMSSESSGNVYTIGIRDKQGTYKAIASFQPEEGNMLPINLGDNKPTLYLTPIGAIYLGQTVGHYVNGTYE